MGLKSSFDSDLAKEQKLAVLLDAYYAKHLKNYDFKRVKNRKEQFQGVDVNFIHKISSNKFHIDEKAQLDYINEDLPTFAFEICYYKNEIEKEGWFFDIKKKTDFYALITAIYNDGGTLFSTCKITLVNRARLQDILIKRGLDKTNLRNHYNQNFQGKICVNELDCRKEGYLFLSKKNKAERPLNLILKLDWLLELGVAKRLV
ncbi:hypothetical protein [Croceitalea rosinachiae]|uniref:Uncharacterized protein n=1 Tax=Croceitalea rosinachiae TaxID=3075596 RepID=A0ABU3A7Y3_9FLAO|nr:hypothetical protein [Croceitalea sp. F388]MDT0606289.1 hypothetical protein [Croceitalea sp. F388]